MPNDPTGRAHLQAGGYANIDRDALPVMICDRSTTSILVLGGYRILQGGHRPRRTAMTWAFAPLIAVEELIRGF